MARIASNLVLAAWCGVLFFYGIAAGPVYRTESLRAIIGAESLRGHWLYPVLYGEPFLTKPPGHYAAIAVCSLPFGEVTDWSARLPSAIAAAAVVFLMWGMLRSAFDERRAFLAAMLIPTSVLWLDKAPSAEIDITLTAWVVASLVLFHKAIASPRVGLWIASLLCVAAGTLTKWTAPAFFYLTVIPFLAWRRQLQLLFGWRHLLAAAVAASAILGWAAAVASDVGWNKLIDTIAGEASYRFHAPAKAKGTGWLEMATFPLLVLAAHLPLALFALRTLRPCFLRQLDDRERSLLQLLHCWVWPNLLFWSLVPNHNVRYVLPLSPALMALGALGLFGGALPFGSRLIRWVGGFLLIWLIAKIVFVEMVIPRRTEHHDARQTASQLRKLVPDGVPLYIHKLKDEGVMFYFGRAVRKLHEPHELPPGAYAVFIRQEWDDRGRYGDVQLVRWMYDQQGDPLILAHCQ
ncbi:MAG TPA: glycosyltransferase family 39 protein [Urbifossiella sp.]|nr:glycosyltransferase family 39 protein [Urbifossiella sp.]